MRELSHTVVLEKCFPEGRPTLDVGHLVSMEIAQNNQRNGALIIKQTELPSLAQQATANGKYN